jgi:hypothetical protein
VRFVKALDARCAENVPTWQWMLGQFSETAERCRLAEEFLSTAGMVIEAVHLDAVHIGGHHRFVSRRGQYHLRTKLGLKTGVVTLEIPRPIFEESVECELGFVQARAYDLTTLTLVAFDVSFLDVYASLSTIVAVRAGPENGTEVVKSIVAML